MNSELIHKMKKVKGYKYLIGGLSLFYVISVKAQSSNDFGIWSTIEVEKKMSKKWALNGELEVRTVDNTSNIGRWGLKLGTDYSMLKELKVGFAYQFLYFHDLEYSDFQPRHRLIGFLQGRKKWGNVVFTLRERIQMTTKDENDRIKASGKIDTYKMNPEWTWRNRLKVAYDIPNHKLTPSFAAESFYQLNNPDGNEFEGLRYTLSLAYKLNKCHAVDLSGILDKEYNVNNPVTRYILSIGYQYNF